MELHKKKCVPCRGDIPPFTKDQIDEYLKFLSGEKKAFYLTKGFKFKNFEDSLGFINKLSQIAEEEGHHPDLKFGWGYAEVNIYTHAIKGLSLSDFILASKIDMISV